MCQKQILCYLETGTLLQTLKIYIKNHIIGRVAVTKFLGILIDGGLNWKEHID